MDKYQQALNNVKDDWYGKDDLNTLQELINKYKELKNELCLYCGRYKQEHMGACAECRWHNE